MNRSKGLTLIEMMLVIAVLAIGVLAAAGLQGTALGFNNKAKALQTVNSLLDAELSLRRQITTSAVTNQNCKTTVSEGYTCSVTAIPCAIVNQSFSCSSSASPVRAYQVTVSVTGPSGTTGSLQTIAAVDQ